MIVKQKSCIVCLFLLGNRRYYFDMTTFILSPLERGRKEEEKGLLSLPFLSQFGEREKEREKE